MAGARADGRPAESADPLRRLPSSFFNSIRARVSALSPAHKFAAVAAAPLVEPDGRERPDPLAHAISPGCSRRRRRRQIDGSETLEQRRFVENEADWADGREGAEAGSE